MEFNSEFVMVFASYWLSLPACLSVVLSDCTMSDIKITNKLYLLPTEVIFKDW